MNHQILYPTRGHRGHGRMVVGFITTYAITAYHHWREFKSHSGEVYSIQHNVLSSTNKTDLYDITEILLKVALNTITHPISHN